MMESPDLGERDDLSENSGVARQLLSPLYTHCEPLPAVEPMYAFRVEVLVFAPE